MRSRNAASRLGVVKMGLKVAAAADAEPKATADYKDGDNVLRKTPTPDIYLLCSPCSKL